MLRILDRYILKEITPSFLLGIGVFTFVLLLNEILRLAQKLVTQSATASETASILLNLLPSVLCLTIPMGFLLGVLIALGRLSADSEIVAMRASGVSLYRLLVPILVTAAVGWLLTSHLIIQVLPDSNQRVRQLLFQVMTSQAGTEVRPRVFYDRLFPNFMFLVMDKPTGAQYWQNVILADLATPESPRVTFAEEGRLLVDRNERTVSFYLRNAELHQVSQNEPDDYQRQVSAEFWLPLPTASFFPPEDIDVPRGARELGLAQLRTSYDETGLPVYLTEIHKKFSIPFACFVFGVLGLGLGIRNRRDGRSWGFVASLSILFVYYLLIDMGESMANNGRLSPLLGMWTANLVLGALAIVLLVRAAREAPMGVHFLGGLGERFRAFEKRVGLRPAPVRKSRPVVVLRVPRFSLRFPNTMDRYVAREFTRYFALVLAALVVVYVLGLLIDVIADAFQNRIKGKVVLQYLLFEQPQILFFMLPLATLMANLVNFAIFTKTSELTAAKAGGISLYRLSVPVVLMGLMVSGACFSLQEYVLPYANRRAAELRDEIKKRPVETYNVLDRRWMMGQENQIYNYAFYDPGRRRFNGLAVYRYSTEPFGITERLYAHEADWIDSEGAWNFKNGWRRNFREGGKVEAFDELKVPGIEPPSYFVKEERRSEQMTYLELGRYVADLKHAGFDVVRLEVALRAKLAFPLAALVTVLIGIPFSFTPGRKGALYGIGIAIAIGLSYYVITRLFAFMGETAMIPPGIAAWAPNALFSIGALYGLFNVRT
jgi:LPS export ABC transporter permease LptG/LPS export ABC transporter permease LptF